MSLSPAEAMSRLKNMVQWDQRPQLTDAELDDLLSLAARPDPSGTLPQEIAAWSPTTAVTVGDARRPAIPNGYVYRCSRSGMTGAIEPMWPIVIGEPVNDGLVQWTTQARAWKPTYSLFHAAAEGWEWKAGKVAGLFDVRAGDVGADRSQMYDHCKRMAENYRLLAANGAYDGGGSTAGGTTAGGFGVIVVRPALAGEVW